MLFRFNFAALLAALAGWMVSVCGASAAGSPLLERSGKVAPNIYEIALDDATDRLFVASAGTNGSGGAIYLVNAQSLENEGRIDLPDAAFGLAFAPSTRTLYATHTRSGTVSAIAVDTGTIIGTIALPPEDDRKSSVRKAVVDESTRTVYVSVVGRESVPSEIWIIDGRSNQLTGRIKDVGTSVTGLGLAPSTKRLYATDMKNNQVVVIDLSTHTIVARFSSGGLRPLNVAVSPTEDRIFVTNYESGSVAMLDAMSGSVVATVETGKGALDLAYSHGLSQLYVTNRTDGTLAVLDGELRKEPVTFRSGTHPNSVVISGKSRRVYVSNKTPVTKEGIVDDPSGDIVTVYTPTP